MPASSPSPGPPTIGVVSSTPAEGAPASMPASAAPAQPELRRVTAESPYKTMTLPNGLQVVVVEDHSIPLTTIDIAVRNGSFTEPDEYAGLSHLYEHMFFKANTAIPSQELFMKRIRELGIVFNGYTSRDIVTYFFTLPSTNLKPGMKFMSDAIKSPLFDSTELVKEREVVLGEFDRNEANPLFALRYALDSALWMPYVARKQPLGQRPVIKTATVEKMRMIQKRFYIPNNSALIVSGDVNADDVFNLAKEYFSDWQRGSDPFPANNPPPFPPLKSKLVVREAKIPDVVIQMRMRGPTVVKDDPDTHTGQLIMTMINEPTSRLYHSLVDSGLATGFGAGLDNSLNTGDITFFVQAPPEKARRALEVLKSELRMMGMPGYFTPEDIAVGKQIIGDNSMFERDNLFAFTTQVTAPWWSMASLDYYLNFPNVVQGLTAGQVLDFTHKYITGQPFALGVGARQEVLNKLNFTEEALKW